MADSLPTLSYATITGRHVALITDTMNEKLADGTDDINDLPDVVPLVAQVTLTPSVPRVLVETSAFGPLTVELAPHVIQLDGLGRVFSGGNAYLKVVATDTVNAMPTDFTYRVSYADASYAGRAVSIPPFDITAPAGTTIDLTKVAQIPSKPGTVIVRDEAAAKAAQVAAETAATSADDSAAAAAASALKAEQAAWRDTDLTARAAAAAAAVPLTSGRVVVTGDSIDQRRDQNGAKPYFGGSPWSYLALRSKQRFNLARNVAVGGRTTAQMLAGFATEVLAYKPGIVVIGGGRNDLNGGVATATTRANIASMVTQARNAGIEPVLHTLAPVDIVGGGAFNTVALNRQGTINHNTWLKKLAADRRLTVIDVWDIWADKATGGWKAGYTDDGVHQTEAANTEAVNALLAALPPIFRGRVPLPTTDPFPGNMLSNPLATIDVDANGQPDGWYIPIPAKVSFVPDDYGKKAVILAGDHTPLYSAGFPAEAAMDPTKTYAFYGELSHDQGVQATVQLVDQSYQTVATAIISNDPTVDGVFYVEFQGNAAVKNVFALIQSNGPGGSARLGRLGISVVNLQAASTEAVDATARAGVADLKGRYGSPTADVSQQSLDNLIATGVYRGYQMTGVPAEFITGWFYVEVIQHSSDWVFQRITGFTDAQSGRTFTRQKTNGAWGAWTEQGTGLPYTPRSVGTGHGPDGSGNFWRVRLATLNGVNAAAGADVEMLLTGIGDYGVAQRGTVLIHAVQRGSNTVTLKAWGWNVENTSHPANLYTVQISEFVFEIWAVLDLFMFPPELHILHRYNATAKLDGDTTDAIPAGAKSWPILAHYVKPAAGIPDSDLATPTVTKVVTTAVSNATTTVPGTGQGDPQLRADLPVPGTYKIEWFLSVSGDIDLDVLFRLIKAKGGTVGPIAIEGPISSAASTPLTPSSRMYTIGSSQFSISHLAGTLGTAVPVLVRVTAVLTSTVAAETAELVHALGTANAAGNSFAAVINTGSTMTCKRVA